MSEYRQRSDGAIKSKSEIILANKNMSLPKVWNDDTYDALGIDPVLPAPAPDATGYQKAQRSGAVQDANGNWVQGWEVVDMFSDTTENGVTVTKAELEQQYQDGLDATAAENARAHRDALLAKTDFYALSDVTMSDEMATYRQLLRDITAHENWPNLELDDWPVKP